MHTFSMRGWSLGGGPVPPLATPLHAAQNIDGWLKILMAAQNIDGWLKIFHGWLEFVKDLAGLAAHGWAKL